MVQNLKALALLALTVRTFAQAPPTVILGPPEDYQKPPAETATASGSDLIITPKDLSQGIPPDGLDLFLGPDLKTQVSQTLKATSQWMDGPVEAHQHIPAAVVSQLQAQTASTIQFETSTGAPPVTVTMAPATSTAATPATITTLSTDSETHHKGDVLINIPAQPADLLLQLILMEGHCKLKQSRMFVRRGPRPDLTVATNAAMTVLYNAGRFTPLDLFDITGLPQRLLHYRDEAVQAALVSVQEAALKLPVFAGVAVDITKEVASIVFAAAYGVCIDNISRLEQIAIESSMVSEDPIAEDGQEEDKNCPKDKPLCDEAGCLGIEGVCQMVNVFIQHGTRSEWDAGQQLIGAMLKSAAPEAPKLDCDADARVDLESGDFTKLVDSFCNGFNLKPDLDKNIDPKEAGSRGEYTGTSFNFAWKAKDGQCSTSCADIFAAFRSSTVCSYDSHTMSKSGSQETACGTASFKFDKSETEDSDPVVANPLKCGDRTDQGNAEHFMPLDTMNKAIDKFCNQGRGDKSRVLPIDKHAVYVEMTALKGPDCPATNFKSKATKQMCKDELKYIINTCDTSNPSGAEDWKQGGEYTKGCFTYAIRLAPASLSTYILWGDD
ncbi:uncharacterized protein MYCGRDRAFT_107811 [Zymoseptoria tritici IPO323]|uniref:Ca2+-modulated nonselective cation channel polycystin n=1 Tax=Zymoseptoria tritici (strain CBS 115943 / IPO323) TaxID=336722 RepID=F9X1X8_ZYMTI|nr:uncharacterized protein MYCGRDRAFT_107811 [Zymoseptoria tritici IPO323]EGP89673.1 hypothetical protein MYCGRDRAFT_107811 [Zymoseptoria tritici IPO323]